MSLHTYIERLKYVDDLIRRRATGDLSSLAKKLNLSRSQTGEFINQMKDEGFPIKYSRKLGCYCYTEEGKLVRNFFERNSSIGQIELSNNQLRSISGGKTGFNLFLHTDYIGMKDSNFVLQTPR